MSELLIIKLLKKYQNELLNLKNLILNRSEGKKKKKDKNEISFISNNMKHISTLSDIIIAKLHFFHTKKKFKQKHFRKNITHLVTHFQQLLYCSNACEFCREAMYMIYRFLSFSKTTI